MKVIHKLLLVLFIIISLIGIVAGLSINFSRLALQESLIDSSKMLANEVLANIDMSIHKRLEETQVYSTDVMLLKTLEKSNAEFDRLDNIQVFIDKIDKAWASIPEDKKYPVIDKLIHNDLSIELRERREYYKETYGYSLFPEIFVTNKYGAIVALTGKTSDYRQDDEKWWQEAKEKRIHISDLEYDNSAAIYSISLGVRIDDQEGNFSGVIKL